MADGLNVAVLGCGRIARLVHLPVLARLPGVRVAAIADSDAEALAAAGALAPGASRHSDWRAALAAPGVAAAIITLPPALHAESAAAAFAAGLHVYVEKPLAMTLKEGEAILSAHAASGRAGQIGLNFRHHPRFGELRARLGAGELGAPVMLRTCFTSARRALPAWKTARDTGGGVIRDLGVHHLDLAEWLLGEPLLSVAAVERSVAAEADVAQLVAVSRSGVPVAISVSLASGDSVNRVELWGEAGHVTVDTLDRGPRPLERPASRSRAAGVRAALAGLAPGALLGQPQDGSFPAALGAFAAAAAGGGAATPDLAVGQRALRLVLAAEEAAASGRAVAIPA